LKSAGGDLTNVMSTIWFVTSAEEFYKTGASTIRWKYFKSDFPTSTLVEVKGLANPELVVEVQAFAVL
jgi:2-iminobutanoate/2-iminopropanoate deaminase